MGRAPSLQCAVAISEKYVSNVHAELRWLGHAWELKDLGSLNGTYLDGRRLTAKVAHRLGRGAQIAFGKLEQQWEMVDDSAPMSMAVPVEGGAPVVIDDEEMIALPSKEDPQATIYKTNDGQWILERPDELPMTVSHGKTFAAVGRVWRFCNPETMAGTTLVTDDLKDLGPYVRNLRLEFSVSRNQEYVHLRVQCGDGEYDLGARQHHFLLLTLARHWLKEGEEGEPEISRGWLDQEDVAHDPSLATTRLNLAVHRIRGQFANIGVIDFGSIIQRRLRELRIGTGQILIVVV